MTTAGPLGGRAGRLARLLPSGPSTAARTPFVLLVVVLLGGGLITLLLLNSSLNQGSFELSELKKRTTGLTDEEQELQREVDGRSAPDALERRARQLGMVPGGSPAFLDPDGTVRGKPSRATAEPSPPPADPAALPGTGGPAAPPGAATAPQTGGQRPVPAPGAAPEQPAPDQPGRLQPVTRPPGAAPPPGGTPAPGQGPAPSALPTTPGR
ncbi:septum formation initiator family protein [Streptomyces sp. NPDC047097]|uniref:FtsB family cell division protein n=1 Tax=Streptomyces sp. NPDC047097 TaxID=3155260 RepID=UPI0033E88AD5